MTTATTRFPKGSKPDAAGLTRIAVGVHGFPEGEDAAVLGTALSRAMGAELLLVTVQSDPLVLPPLGVNWATLREEARSALRTARTAHAPNARTVVEIDFSVPRGLQRVVRREHRDLLVVGSSRHAENGRVRIGKRTRQLLCRFECPLAVAQRGLHEGPGLRLRRIGVGYDGGAESEAALKLAASIAIAVGAKLTVQSVLDIRMPPTWWSGLAKAGVEMAEWEEAISAEVDRRAVEAGAAVEATGASACTDVKRGRPADALLALSEEVELLVIGSRHWGSVARVLLGSTGEALLHDAACSVLVLPRPPA
jgi:nucleotide-binding universal stress UspA family protein